MNAPDELKQKLLDRIKSKRATITTYASTLEKRGNRLTNVGLVCTTVTSVLTAGPAFGGTTFTSTTSDILGLPNASLVWRFLCLAAVILSLIAALANNANKPSENASKLIKAQATGVLMEKLEMALEFDHVTPEAAAKQFQDYLLEVTFIHDKA